MIDPLFIAMLIDLVFLLGVNKSDIHIPIEGSPQSFFLLGSLISVSVSSGIIAEDSCADEDDTAGEGDRIISGPTIAVSSDKVSPSLPAAWSSTSWLRDAGARNRTLLEMVRWWVLCWRGEW